MLCFFPCISVNKMANELYGIMYGNVQTVSGQTVQTAYNGEESFLREVITPIYQVMRKVNYFLMFVS